MDKKELKLIFSSIELFFHDEASNTEILTTLHNVLSHLDYYEKLSGIGVKAIDFNQLRRLAIATGIPQKTRNDD